MAFEKLSGPYYRLEIKTNKVLFRKTRNLLYLLTPTKNKSKIERRMERLIQIHPKLLPEDFEIHTYFKNYPLSSI